VFDTVDETNTVDWLKVFESVLNPELFVIAILRVGGHYRVEIRTS
jgi:hypothetical protein